MNCQYATVPMELTGTGGFANCVRYLHELHEQLPDTTCTAVRLTGTPENPAAAHFVFELSWHAASDTVAAMPMAQQRLLSDIVLAQTVAKTSSLGQTISFNVASNNYQLTGYAGPLGGTGAK